MVVVVVCCLLVVVLFVVRSSVFVARCSLFVVLNASLLFVVCLWFVVCCVSGRLSSSVDRGLLSCVCCPRFAVRCASFVARRSLFVVRCCGCLLLFLNALFGACCVLC